MFFKSDKSSSSEEDNDAITDSITSGLKDSLLISPGLTQKPPLPTRSPSARSSELSNSDHTPTRDAWSVEPSTTPKDISGRVSFYKEHTPIGKYIYLSMRDM